MHALCFEEDPFPFSPYSCLCVYCISPFLRPLERLHCTPLYKLVNNKYHLQQASNRWAQLSTVFKDIIPFTPAVGCVASTFHFVPRGWCRAAGLLTCHPLRPVLVSLSYCYSLPSSRCRETKRPTWRHGASKHSFNTAVHYEVTQLQVIRIVCGCFCVCWKGCFCTTE